MKKIIILALAATLFAACGRQEAKMDYPVAEWDKAGEILMHTPWEELFDGVAHPAAGLFEDYFDVDEAAREHRNYAKMLEKNGIRVHFVTDVLYETGIDTLRMLAAEGLRYDISDNSDTDLDESEAYKQQILGKMSRFDLLRCILLRPTVKLHQTDNNTGVEAEYIHNPMMNLYFTRDQSITTPRGHIICRMNSSQRAVETDIIEVCYHHLGTPPILRIEGDGRLEAQPGEPEYNTCDIYVRAPGEKEYRLWLSNLPFVEFICTRGMQIIPIDEEDELHYANNFLTIAPRHIMAVGGQSETYQELLRNAGVQVEWIPLESLINGYGAAHCMTQVLKRKRNE